MKRVILLVVPLMVAGLWMDRSSVAVAKRADEIWKEINLSGEPINGRLPKGKAKFRARGGRPKKFNVEGERSTSRRARC
jgi:hypothetical protein